MATKPPYVRKNKNYRSVSIHRTLYARIEKVKGVLGYSGIAAFIDQAVRDKLKTEEWKYQEALEKLLKEEKGEFATEREIPNY